MTEAERKMLYESHDAIMELKKAFLEVPPGSPKEERPLLENLRMVVKAYQRASWSTRALIYTVPVLAMLGASYQTILGWFK